MSRCILLLLSVVFMAGCVEVGGSSSDVCTGSECGTHDESNHSVTTDTTD